MKALLLALALFAPVQSLDEQVRKTVQEARRPGPERVMRAASEAGKGVVVFAVLLGIAAFDRAAGPATARITLAALLGTNLAVEGLKRATFRARPDGEHKRSNAAFPSSHAANAFTIAYLFARRWRRLAAVFWLGAATVAFSRVYLDRHWLSDVVCGALLGVLCAWAAVRWLWGWAERRPRVPRAPQAMPDRGA